MLFPLRAAAQTLAVQTLAFLLLGPALLAQAPLAAPPPGLLLATNQYANTLSIIDPVMGKEIAVLPEEHITGHELATSPDGRTVFIPIYGNTGVGKPGTDGHEILAVDIASRHIAHVIDLGHGVRPHKPIYNPADGLLYVSAELDNAIDIIDPKSFKLVGSIPTGEPQSHMFVLSPDGHRAYTANVSTGTVSVLDLKARKLVTVIAVARQVQRIAISNDGALVFTSAVDKPELDVIDTRTNTVQTRIPLLSNSYGAAATADGHSLLLALPSIDQVAVIDLRTLKVARTIPTPPGPQAILLRPDGHAAFVSCVRSKTIVTINTDTFQVAQTIAAGNGVDGLAWANTAR